MEQNIQKFSLNEIFFTQLCKTGFFKHNSKSMGSFDINFNRSDITQLFNYGIVSKEYTDDVLMFFVDPKMTKETMKEIIKRSPIFSELSNTL